MENQSAMMRETSQFQDPELCLGSRAAKRQELPDFSSSLPQTFQGKKQISRPGRLELLLEDFEAEVGQGFSKDFFPDDSELKMFQRNVSENITQERKKSEMYNSERRVLEKRTRLERGDSLGLGALERMAKMLKYTSLNNNYFSSVNRFKGEVGAGDGADKLVEATSPTSSSESLLAQKYILGEEIGRGQFGVVKACVGRKDKNQYACKTVRKSNLPAGEATDGVRTEARLASVLGRHPHIVRHVEVLEDESFIHLIMERCTAGDLYTLVETHKWLPEELASSIFRKIVSAVSFCHSHNILHRDLKPENILLTQGGTDGQVEPKVADFGLARLVAGPEGSAGRWVGSVYYMAPEVVANHECSRASDVWSLGALLYVMLSGFLPFKGSSVHDTASRICRGELSMNSGPWRWVSESAKDLIRQMMTADPHKRPKASDILSHSWLTTEPSTPSLEAKTNQFRNDKQTVYKPLAQRKPSALSIPSGPSVSPNLSPLQSLQSLSTSQPLLPLLSLLPVVSPTSDSASPNSKSNSPVPNRFKPTPLWTQCSLKSRDYSSSPSPTPYPPTPKTLLLETLRLAATFAGANDKSKSSKSDSVDGFGALVNFSAESFSASLFPIGCESFKSSPKPKSPRNRTPIFPDQSNASNSKPLNPALLLGLSPKPPVTPNVENSYPPRSMFLRENSTSSS